MQLVKGVTRWVVITQKSVIKFPSLESYRQFLMGLLSNLHEELWWESSHDARLCPVSWCCPGGFFLIMPRCEPPQLPIDYDHYEYLPLDAKEENFGYYKDRNVLLDYGS